MSYVMKNPPAEADAWDRNVMARHCAGLVRFAGREAQRAPRSLRDGLTPAAWMALTGAQRLARIEARVIADWRRDRGGAADGPSPAQPDVAAHPGPAVAEPAPAPAPAPAPDATIAPARGPRFVSRWSVSCALCGAVRRVPFSPRPVSGMCPACRDKRASHRRNAATAAKAAR